MNKKEACMAAALSNEDLMMLADQATDAIKALHHAMTQAGKHFKIDEISDSAQLLRAAHWNVAYVAGSIDEN